MEPAWYPERMFDLKTKRLKSGDKIFVGSSGDLWGNWVHDDYIGDVLDMTEFYPDNIFQFVSFLFLVFYWPAMFRQAHHR